MVNKIKAHCGIILIAITGFVLRLYMAALDPFLHDWDEKYHALVAKNMMLHPFKPMLYTHQYFSTDLYNWTYNHIWLHKQPFFLWQMAMSMKIFGVSELSVRLPSVVMGTLMIVLVYRISLLVTSNKMAALLSAILLCFNNYYLNLISGREGMDHNDIAFGFYVLASFWALAEYLNKPTWKWVVMVGLFAGCAVLNKWLTGLIVFAPWGILSIKDFTESKRIKSVFPITAAFATCCIVFAPWQFYILSTFPDIAKYEYAFNAKHIGEVIDGHGGDIWTYLNFFPSYFGWHINFLIPFGFILLILSNSIPFKYKILLSVAPIVVFSFFSFIVQTKMQGYFFMIAPLCFVLMGLGLNKVVDLSGSYKNWAALILLPVCIYLSLNLHQINNYTNDKNYRQSKIYNTNIYKSLDALLPENINVVINSNPFEHVDIMFYSNRIEAYHLDISEKEFKIFARSNLPIAAFESREGHVLPDYILQYKHLHIIKAALK
jgi:4-amino-4-deoxy-L-arabinose transferase